MILQQIEQMLEQYGITFKTEHQNHHHCILSPIQKENSDVFLNHPSPFCSQPKAEYHMIYSITVTAINKGSKIKIEDKEYLITACDCYSLGDYPIYQWATIRLLGEEVI